MRIRCFVNFLHLTVLHYPIMYNVKTSFRCLVTHRARRKSTARRKKAREFLISLQCRLFKCSKSDHRGTAAFKPTQHSSLMSMCSSSKRFQSIHSLIYLFVVSSTIVTSSVLHQGLLSYCLQDCGEKLKQ